MLLLSGGGDKFDWANERDLASKGGVKPGKIRTPADDEEAFEMAKEMDNWSEDEHNRRYREAVNDMDGNYPACCIH